ncbi:LOW QUALITY PROTEIN: hypothetical protein TorRG33x02_194350 [Trema orientale]|uniref:Uncharacterized protein n=1 Tax=Trema orientale TaxID=63057 RepID=A0A2P5EGQ3_TREOI|nr:LOW QUALITY PROTEIN: hypothetical protein TorRG33x02_194350 [Trema orientale]
MVEIGCKAEKLMLLLLVVLLLLHACWSWFIDGFSSASRESFKRLAAPPTGRALFAIASTSYRFISKFVTAFTPLNLIAAMSYASAASSSVAVLGQ